MASMTLNKTRRLRNSLAVSFLVHLAVLSVTVVHGMGSTARMDMRNAIRISLSWDSAISTVSENGSLDNLSLKREITPKRKEEPTGLDKPVSAKEERVLNKEHIRTASVVAESRDVDDVITDSFQDREDEASNLDVLNGGDGVKAEASALADGLSKDPGIQGPGVDSGRYNIMLGLIKAAIQKAVRYPVLARKRGIEGTVIAEFYIDEKGSAEGIKVIKSSGHGILDRETLQIIRRASPYPPLGGKVEVPVRFSLMEADG